MRLLPVRQQDQPTDGIGKPRRHFSTGLALVDIRIGCGGQVIAVSRLPDHRCESKVLELPAENASIEGYRCFGIRSMKITEVPSSRNIGQLRAESAPGLPQPETDVLGVDAGGRSAGISNVRRWLRDAATRRLDA